MKYQHQDIDEVAAVTSHRVQIALLAQQGCCYVIEKMVSAVGIEPTTY
jgi:hypothetical protein